MVNPIGDESPTVFKTTKPTPQIPDALWSDQLPAIPDRDWTLADWVIEMEADLQQNWHGFDLADDILVRDEFGEWEVLA